MPSLRNAGFLGVVSVVVLLCLREAHHSRRELADLRGRLALLERHGVAHDDINDGSSRRPGSDAPPVNDGQQGPADPGRRALLGADHCYSADDLAILALEAAHAVADRHFILSAEKANVSNVTAAWAELATLKAEASTLATQLADKVGLSSLATQLAEKAGTAATNSALATKADKSAVPTTAAVNTALAGKVNTATLTTQLGTKVDTAAMTAALAVVPTTAAMNTALGTKADKSAVPTTAAMTAALATKADLGSQESLACQCAVCEDQPAGGDMCVPWKTPQACDCLGQASTSQPFPASTSSPPCCRQEWPAALTVTQTSTAPPQVYSQNDVKIKINGAMTFVFTGFDNVQQVDDFTSYTPTSNNAIRSGNPANGGTFSHTFTSAGVYFFSSQTHATLKIKVAVVDCTFCSGERTFFGALRNPGWPIPCGLLPQTNKPDLTSDLAHVQSVRSNGGVRRQGLALVCRGPEQQDPWQLHAERCH